MSHRYEDLELVLQTIHLDNAEQFVKNAKVLHHFRDKTIRGPKDMAAAAKIIQKIVRGIQGDISMYMCISIYMYIYVYMWLPALRLFKTVVCSTYGDIFMYMCV